MKKTISFVCLLVLLTSWCFAVSLEEANMYYKYGLLEKAKEKYIEVILSGKESEKPEAYYQLGSVVYDENSLALALETWKTLIEKYPKSEYSKMVEDRILVLAEAVGQSNSDLIDNTIAKSYLSNGDFWSKGKDTSFTIDTSWIGHVEAAIYWYDKVIKEFPGTSAAETAYVAKLRTIKGWSPSKYTSYGIDSSFSKYMPMLLETFAAFEKEFPEASTLQAFRYQIAQIYWNQKDWANTRLWLNKIKEVAGSSDTFYKDLAQRRLTKVEY